MRHVKKRRNERTRIVALVATFLLLVAGVLVSAPGMMSASASGSPSTTDQVDDKEKAAAAIQDSGAVALISMRPIAVNKQQTFVPPSYTGPGGPYGGWGPYYGYGWGAPYSPGYVVTDTIVRIETLVFDLKQNKLVWAGQSETTNPDRLDQFMRELVKTVGDDMRRKGVIAAPAS